MHSLLGCHDITVIVFCCTEIVMAKKRYYGRFCVSDDVILFGDLSQTY